MKTLLTILIFACVVVMQVPSGTATPAARSAPLPRNPTIGPLVCDFWAAPWGRTTWPGTRERPFKMFQAHKRVPKFSTVCGIVEWPEVNGNAADKTSPPMLGS